MILKIKIIKYNNIMNYNAMDHVTHNNKPDLQLNNYIHITLYLTPEDR